MAKNFHVFHVKGHQDDHSIYQDLDLPARLNIDADWLAGCYHRTHSTDINKVIQLLINQVQLNTPSGTISGY
eukprot:2440103-Ditylum_brightwellii.AAC.1